MINQELANFLAPLRRRVSLMIGRCVILATNDAKALQELQVRALIDEELDRVERIQNYGFTSHPHAGAEAVLVCVGGNRNHALIIAVEDKRYRLTGLESGAVAIYDDLGQKIVLGRSGIEIETKQADGVKITAPKVEIITESANVKTNSMNIDCPAVAITGALIVGGAFTASGSVSLGSGSQKIAREGDSICLTSGKCVGDVGIITSGAEGSKA